VGTEKFIRELSRNLQNNGYSHMNIFSFYDDKGRMKMKLFGVNYNECVVGIFKYCDLLRVIDSLTYK